MRAALGEGVQQAGGEARFCRGRQGAVPVGVGVGVEGLARVVVGWGVGEEVGDCGGEGGEFVLCGAEAEVGDVGCDDEDGDAGVEGVVGGRIFGDVFGGGAGPGGDDDEVWGWGVAAADAKFGGWAGGEAEGGEGEGMWWGAEGAGAVVVCAQLRVLDVD